MDSASGLTRMSGSTWPAPPAALTTAINGDRSWAMPVGVVAHTTTVPAVAAAGGGPVGRRVSDGAAGVGWEIGVPNGPRRVRGSGALDAVGAAPEARGV